MSLRNREVILAGGSGGLGAPTARLLAGEGAKLVVSYRGNAERAESLRGIATLQQADIAQPFHRTSLLDTSPHLYGLVIFSGMAARRAEDWNTSLEINFTGPIQLAREAATRMKQNGGGGAIVLIGTMQAVGLFPQSTAYAAAKAALVHAGRILAKECRGPSEIRVNIVSPGVMNAGMAAQSIESGKYNRFLQEGAIPRWGQAEDVARAVRFFLEPDNYVTGQHLLVDGGLNL